MSDPNTFAARSQEPYGDIPTDPDAFLEWASRQPREAGRFELTRQGTVTMMQGGTSRYHNDICTSKVRLAGLGIEMKLADIHRNVPVEIRSD